MSDRAAHSEHFAFLNGTPGESARRPLSLSLTRKIISLSVDVVLQDLTLLVLSRTLIDSQD